MDHFFINRDTCSKCGICVEICPASVIQKNKDGEINFVANHLHLCVSCGQCMAVCHTKSIVVKGFSYETDFFELSDNKDFFSLVEHRRSVRRFKPMPVNKSDMEKILYALTQAPHGDAHHHVEVTIVNSREKIMEALPHISAFYDKLEKWLQNPIIRHMIKKKKGSDTLNTLRNHLLPRIKKGIYRNVSYEYDGITRGAHTLMLFHAHKDSEEHKEDSYILVTYAMLAAQALGLGSTIIGLVPPAINKSKELRKIFAIPDDHESVVSIILGYPKYKYRRGIKRQLKKINWLE